MLLANRAMYRYTRGKSLWQKSVAKVQHKTACAHELARPCGSLAVVKQGLWYAVIAQGHTLVLNWNPQLVPLLKQMSLAKTHQIKAVLHDK